MKDVKLIEIRCPVCGRKLLDCNGLAYIKCNRCKSLVTIDTKNRIVTATKPILN